MTFSRLQLAGSALIVLGILSLEPVLGKNFLSEKFTEFPGNIIAALASLLVIGTGASLMCWRMRVAFLGISGKEIWARLLLLSLPLLLLALAEVALITADHLNDPVDADDQKARKMMKENWGKLKYKDMPMVAPVKSAVFNVNSKGFRTYELDAPHKGEKRIMLLGGSTAFGWGVADHHVIDSNLEQILRERTGSPVKVFNLSIPAVVFSTENMMLKDFFGTVTPDIVVFYHGANDGLAWYEQTIGRASTSQTLAPSFFSKATLLHYAYKSRVFRLFTEATRPSSPVNGAPEIDVSKAVTDYESHFSESRRLCASTKCLYLIQPVIFNKGMRTSREVKIYRTASALFPQYEQVYEKYTDAIIAKAFADHVDAREAFSRSSEDIFLDYVHVSAEGNRLMALFIAGALCDGGYVHCH